MVALLRLGPGTLFASDFEIRELIAEGGMGMVYAATDRLTGEACALKVLLPELVADEETRRRFAQEARIGVAIDSPHVPRVTRAGIDEATGMPWIAMELLHGQDLHAYVKQRGPLPREEAADILDQLGSALAAAHAKGLVHRDLKPQNVFLERGPGGLRVKLLDFGVAKIIDVKRSAGTGTAAIGSPLWMAPEQTSAGGRISPATDVFAYGLLAFYVLTGRIYWRSAHDGRSIGGLMRELFVDEPEPASSRARAVAPGIELPPGFDAWLARTLCRDASRRFANGGEASRALGPVFRDPNAAMGYASTMEVPALVVGSAPSEPDIPPTDPPPPMVIPAAHEAWPARRRRVWPWVLAFSAAMILAGMLLGLIVWVVLTIT
jgi:serine/threonine-protein kinase